ncbi:hypothetical protein TWF132_001787 [Orbilia oligospora]|nr:hypothetical protein TWF132_001787 [Orbilia oligospora]KAF3277151.1 hypothetical protein TWF132_001787 [Orbilia oligospora]
MPPEKLKMATLSSLPNEVFNEIVGHLPRKSQLLLRQCSKTLEAKSDKDTLFRTQRYYHSIIDIKNLVAFSTDPAHDNARARCKTLVLDTFSPSSMKIRCKIRLENGEKTMQTIAISTPKFNTHQVVELLTTALDNLPNLECIEFMTTPDVGDVPNAILQTHYPGLGFDIREEKPGKWFKNAYRNATAHAYPHENQTFANAMAAISRSNWQPKVIRFPELTDVRRWTWKSQSSKRYMPSNGPSLEWFVYTDDRILEALRPRLQNLRKLEIPLFLGDSDEYDYEPDETREDLMKARPEVTNFLQMVPNLEELRFKVGSLIRINTPDDSGGWVPLQFPINPVDVGSLRFNNLRILSLLEQAFVEDELKTFLTYHKNTLRKIELINCVLHSPHQLWSGIFELIRTDLTLWSFEFHTEYPKMHQHTTEHLRIVPWFRVYGNVRTADHRCELFPKYESHKQENTHRIDFDQAMQVVTILEYKVVLENNPELTAEKKDILNRLTLLRQGLSPDNPGVPLHESQIRVMMQQLSSRQLAMKFQGIQPKDIKDELTALGVNGFEMENKASHFGQFNSHTTVLRSDGCLKRTAVSTS